MDKQTFKAKDYPTRSGLELVVKAECGTNIEANREAGHEIIGKREELRKLGLSDTSRVWGVKCVITDTPSKDKFKKK